MNRPERQLQNLEAKVAVKMERGKKKLGAKAKRWKKAIEQHKTKVEQAE